MVAAVVNQTANVNTISVPIILCCYFSSSADIWNFVRLFFSVSFYFIIIIFFFFCCVLIHLPNYRFCVMYCKCFTVIVDKNASVV